jgi:hypothetical protein
MMCGVDVYVCGGYPKYMRKTNGEKTNVENKAKEIGSCK